MRKFCAEKWRLVTMLIICCLLHPLVLPAAGLGQQPSDQ